jgi:3-deoxy-D-manno-octulosonic-acid transferase
VHNAADETNHPASPFPSTFGIGALMRFLYSMAWWLGLPLVLARLWWRGRREPGYRQHLGERLGFYGEPVPAAGRKPLWVHAVSVGETRAAEPLITALLQSDPACSILLTHMTATGRATGQALFGANPRVRQCYLPYDTGWMTGRFLAHFAPRLCVLMETEVWPNMMAQCVKRGVPAALVNARLSEQSLEKALRLSTLVTDAAQALSRVAAQNQDDATRLRLLGVRDVQVTGSIKFDVTPPPDALSKGAELRRLIGPRPVLLCASTREGEEEMILDVLFKMNMADTLVAIVPRHPQRFDEVARMIAARGLTMRRKSQLNDTPLTSDVQILLGDSMGEMFAYYAAADVAFVGGSLLPFGGQNLIEPCVLGKPVLIGPYTFNFSAVSDDAVASGAALRAPDTATMLREAVRLMRADDERMAMGGKARKFAEQHRGATARTMALLQPLIAGPAS